MTFHILYHHVKSVIPEQMQKGYVCYTVGVLINKAFNCDPVIEHVKSPEMRNARPCAKFSSINLRYNDRLR